MNEQPRWTQRARALLDESAQGLDAATLSRLNRARQAALGQSERSTAAWFLPAGLVGACVLLLAVGAWHGRTLPSTGAARVDTPVDAGDADALADDEDMYEDLEFYAWLDAQDQDPQG